jgi:hypothetical protein
MIKFRGRISHDEKRKKVKRKSKTKQNCKKSSDREERMAELRRRMGGREE